MTQTGERLGVTSKQVWAWQNRRATSGFPEPKKYGRAIGARGGPKAGPLFDLEEVWEWYCNYVPNKGGAPKGNTHGFQKGNYRGKERTDA